MLSLDKEQVRDRGRLIRSPEVVSRCWLSFWLSFSCWNKELVMENQAKHQSNHFTATQASMWPHAGLMLVRYPKEQNRGMFRTKHVT